MADALDNAHHGRRYQFLTALSHETQCLFRMAHPAARIPLFYLSVRQNLFCNILFEVKKQTLNPRNVTGLPRGHPASRWPGRSGRPAPLPGPPLPRPSPGLYLPIPCLLGSHSPDRDPAIAHQLVPHPSPTGRHVVHDTQALSRETLTWGRPTQGYGQAQPSSVWDANHSRKEPAPPLVQPGPRPLAAHPRPL